MGLLDEIKQETDNTNRPKCTVRLLIEGMPADDAADLTNALADPLITCAAMERALTKLGYDVKQQTLNRHRKGACGCPR